MNIRNNVARIRHVIFRTLLHAECETRVVLAIMLCMTVISMCFYDIVYATHELIIFALVFNAEYWRQSSVYFKTKYNQH